MRAKPFFVILIVIWATAFSLLAQSSWRFGFEYNELGPWASTHHAQLLAKLQKIGTHGGINVNGVGSWAAMQATASSPINFANTDAIIKLFQQYSFSLIWYLRCDAQWAFDKKTVPYAGTALPDSAFEGHWQNYVKAVVERYDGDGVGDMPGLIIPLQFYVMIGEVRFGKTGRGDAEPGPFWFDNFDNLLRLHRLTYSAVKEADASGFSKIVSSGAFLFDLYADFPDYPQCDPANPNSAIGRRLRGENYRGGTFTTGWDSLKKMLRSFADDADGIECDYIGWHPHFSWRVVDQEFKFIHTYGGDKPIFVDDMWCNLFAQGYGGGALVPGEAQFNTVSYATRNPEWVRRINGDFPNLLFPSNDPYADLFQKLNSGDQPALDWYYANGSRRLIKSFVSVFGEGAERACFSGTNDLLRGFEGGWLNLLGTRQENYADKPQYHTFQLLLEKLNDFTTVSEVAASDNPLTRVYRFERPRGTLFVAWSETGQAPANLDYAIPTGETVSIAMNGDTAIVSYPITSLADLTPRQEKRFISQEKLTMHLGYEPVFIEPKTMTSARFRPVKAMSYELVQNYPNPFNATTTIRLNMDKKSRVTVTILDILGQPVRILLDTAVLDMGEHRLQWDGMTDAKTAAVSGIYLCCVEMGDKRSVHKITLLK